MNLHWVQQCRLPFPIAQSLLYGLWLKANILRGTLFFLYSFTLCLVSMWENYQNTIYKKFVKPPKKDRGSGDLLSL